MNQPLGTPTAEVGGLLDAAIANLQGAPPVIDPEAQALADIPLTWDGVGYSRHVRNAERAVGVFGDPVPAQPVDVGWTVWALRILARDGDHRSGLVYEVSDHDPETGEPGTVYLAAYEDHRDGRLDVHRLLVMHDELAAAVPPVKRELTRMLKVCHGRAARARTIDSHVLWLTGVLVPRWQGVMAERGWTR